MQRPHRARKARSAQRPVTGADATASLPIASSRNGSSALVSLGALAAGFGMLGDSAFAQTAPPAPAAAASSPDAPALPRVTVRGDGERGNETLRVTNTKIGKGNQALRDVPQSVTVVTEKLIEDRRIDTLKEALHQTAGISFMAAEGGEEDIRLRGFSLAGTGDIYIDGIRDPAFYDRDLFNFDRVELLRGSASMLFGRGSTGGVVNQVNKVPLLTNVSEVNATIGSGAFTRFTGDFNLKTGENSAIRINAMKTDADNYGNRIDKEGIAPSFRWGINTDDEFMVSLFYLKNDNGIHYGIPWVRLSPTTTEQGLVKIDPKNYYSAASDYSAGMAGYGTFDYTHRFKDGGILHTAVRHGNYERDQRGGTLRFFGTAPTQDTVTNATLLTRGTQNKIQDMTTTYVQTDYSNKFALFGRSNELLSGVDIAREEFANYTATLPPGVALDKNTPRTTIGTPNDGTSVNESLRGRLLNRTFEAKSIGIFAQDTVEIVPKFKLIAGLRYDRFEGQYRNPTVPADDRGRTDSLWSHRFGALYQPSDTQSYYASYGTSFNTSGDTYNYDAPGSKAPPEKSRNIEIGTKLDLFDKRMSARAAVFHSTKYNERNRDSPTGQPLVNYLLSGERHAAGLELDLAGRITPAWEVYGSYAWIPSAKIDKAAFDVDLTGERVGTRPSLTPRHTGTLWTTYQVIPALRIGGGLNARSSQTPNRNPAGIAAPRFITGDLMAEYTINESATIKFNAINVTNKLYADSLYTGHYIPGQGRTYSMTFTGRF